MTTDPFAEFKLKQREGWSHFGPVELFTAPPAAHLVRFAGVRANQTVLDVGAGTGVVALTARRTGAAVTGLDLTPELLVRARANAKIAKYDDIVWMEGDVEALPFGDNSFDVVVSQFGHIFAPRPLVALGEMLRVLKPGGCIAFATWPPEHFVGKLFGFVARFLPLPPSVPSVALWGDPSAIRERFGGSVDHLFFERGVMTFNALSPQHYREFSENTVGPIIKLMQSLAADTERLGQVRRELEELVAPYLVDNAVRQDYLLTRALKKS